MANGCPPAELNGRPVWAPESLAAQVAFYEETLSALGREVGEEALTHLHHRLVTDVAYVDLSRTMFKDTVWTQIEWSRALGHPTEEPMHAGFDVQAKYLLIDGVVSAGGLVHNTSHWVDAVEVRSWDGPHDDETFRVGVMARGQSPWLHWIGVALRDGVTWGGVQAPSWLRPTRRVVYPARLADNGGVFELDRDGITTLEDFRLVPW